jgi:quercetin 2,3-dioxygenase
MLQLWVNLPARDKAGPPGYQSITAAQIPEIALPAGAGRVRVIAGSYGGKTGPARTFTPINVWDVRLAADAEAELPLPDGHNTLLFVLEGEIELADGQSLSGAGLAMFDRSGDSVKLRARRATKLAVLDGLPIDEPVAAYGPFVMNTRAEIEQALDDYRHGRMGNLPAS